MRSDQDASNAVNTERLSRSWEYELVLVTFHSRALVEAMLERLPADIPVVLVDNAQGADGMADVAESRPAVRYLVGPGKGYATGANLGALSSRYPYVIFVNPDSMPTVEQFDSLVADLHSDPQLAAVGALTLQPDGRPELSGGWEPSPARALVHAIGAHKVFRTAGLWARPEPGSRLTLDWLSGSCMAVPMEHFRMLGGFDDSYFVYSEDVDFGRKIREAGLRHRLRTDLCVPHLGTGSGESKDRMLRFRGASMTQYVSRHNGAVRANAIRLVLTAGMGARYVVCRLGRRPDTAREHAAYVRGMWVGAPPLA